MGLVERYALPPDAIEPLSLERLAARLARPLPWQGPDALLAARLMYATGDPSLVDHIRIHPEAVAAGLAALGRGAPVVCDVEMVAAGLDRARLQRLGCPVRVAIGDPQVAARARQSRLPRAVEAMRHLAGAMDGAVVAIGTAPTALLALLDLVDAGAVRPALIVGMPVGFVAAEESKAELVARPVPYVTVLGTRGGAGLAVAAVNTLLRLAAPGIPGAAPGGAAGQVAPQHGSGGEA